MKFIYSIIAFFLLFSAIQIKAQTNTDFSIIGSAYLNNKSFDFLQRICDEAGGRLPGSENNEKALGILKDELGKIGIPALFENFDMPGWFRGDDEVTMTFPVSRKLRAMALGFVDSTSPVSSDVVFAKYGLEENYQNLNATGKIVVVTQEAPPGKEQPLRYESIAVAAKHGAKAILFINEKNGSLLIDGVTNFHGFKSPIPAYTITFEEGNWLRRLLEKDITPKMTVVTRSYCKPIQSKNAIVTFPGKIKDKIVIGAHFDSWDLGQGAVDNGYGTAILFEVCRLLNEFSKDNYYTVECAWLNAEELGLWGAKKYVEKHKSEAIAAMINMDMTGSPTGFNAMGFDEFKPFFENMIKKFNGFNLNAGVVSSPWTNSDHMYFMFAGIPSFTLSAYLEKDMYHYYHDFGDTFDKVNKKMLSDAAAVVAVLVKELANDRTLNFRIRTKDEMKDMMIKNNLDKKLKRQGEWIFGE